tara:strand:- start:173 stop:370 length:198 start_codon:yes stop_codon:yes gene_type:complete
MTVKMNITMCNTMITIYELLVSNDLEMEEYAIFKVTGVTAEDKFFENFDAAFEEFKNRINECYYG